MSRTWIYSRVSTGLQSTDAQLSQLTALFPGAEVVSETASGAKERPLLNATIEKLEKGDVLVVYALDRLGRKASEILALLEGLQEKGIILKSIREGADFSTPVGKLVTQIMLSVAEMERNMIAERTRSGLKAARESGTRLGRPPSEKQEKAIKAANAVLLRNWKPSKAAERWGVNVSYVYAMMNKIRMTQAEAVD